MHRLTSILFAALSTVAIQGLAADDKKPSKFALLVGVGEYPNLSPSEQLSGTENDVRLIARVLTERFGFTEGDIRTLTGREATGEAIRRELGAICTAISRLPADQGPAQVVFHFSGHGGQLPDQNGEGRDEADGLDETLVPSDASKIGSDADIRDDELNQIAHQICGDGRARLWIILDCCHSGTGTRGIEKAIAPGVVRYRALRRNVEPTSTPLSPTTNTLPQGAIALYACRDQELEPEYNDGEATYGLLCRFLAKVLLENHEAVELSFVGLRDAIAARYAQDRRIGVAAPVPQLEGSAALLDAPVLGGTGAGVKRCWDVHGGASRSTMMAGSFHGVTVGSIYELYASPESVEWEVDLSEGRRGDESLGYARVSSVEAASSTVELVELLGSEWRELRWPRDLTRCFAVQRLREPGDFGLAVNVFNASNRANPIRRQDPAFPAVIAAALEGPPGTSIQEDPWFTLAAEGQQGDVDLVFAGERLAIFQSMGHYRLANEADSSGDPLAGGWGPIDMREPDAAERILALLRQITRARNLLRIASRDDAGGKRPVDVRLELLRVPSASDYQATEPWPNSTPERQPGSHVMHSGNLYSYRVSNDQTSAAPVYVTLLHIDADMGIEQVFPYQDGTGIHGLEERLLQPGASRIEGPFECNGVGEASFGLRRTVLLATTEPNHFYMLSQPSLSKVPATRSVGESSLGHLLLESSYFQTRSRRRPVTLFDDSWGSAVLQWTVGPADAR